MLVPWRVFKVTLMQLVPSALSKTNDRIPWEFKGPNPRNKCQPPEKLAGLTKGKNTQVN